MLAANSRDDGRLYVVAWLALLALTLLSFGAHYLELGVFATAVSLAFAAVKASIVFGVFMHITREANSVRVVAALNIACVVLISVGLALDVLGH
jgi:cytochrome c oxidase subunit 4